MTGPLKALGAALQSALTVSAITSIATGGVHFGLAPETTLDPVVIYVHLGGGDRNITPSRLRNPIYLIKGIAQDRPTALDIAEQIDTTLHGATLSVSGWTAYRCEHITDVDYVEKDESGRRWYHSGGMYRIKLSD